MNENKPEDHTDATNGVPNTTELDLADMVQAPAVSAQLFGRVGDVLDRAKRASRLLRQGQEVADDIKAIAERFGELRKVVDFEETYHKAADLVREAISLVTMSGDFDEDEIVLARQIALDHVEEVDDGELKDLAMPAVQHQLTHGFGIAATDAEEKAIAAASIKGRLALSLIQVIMSQIAGLIRDRTAN